MYRNVSLDLEWGAMWKLPGNNKYGAKQTFCACGGRKFHSKKEAKRFAELVMREHAKEIESLYTQVPFLMDSGVCYVADFVYRDVKRNQWIAEDTKGARTDVYKIKKKLFIAEYPQFEFIET